MVKKRELLKKILIIEFVVMCILSIMDFKVTSWLGNAIGTLIIILPLVYFLYLLGKDEKCGEGKRFLFKAFSGFLLICWVGAGIATFYVEFLKIDNIDMQFAKGADVCFVYGDANVLKPMKEEDLELIQSIFDTKKLYKDNPSCGFDENISIKINKTHTFCIARDTCPIVYWKEKDRYIKLMEEEKNQLYKILESYGFSFPCV